ncbi:sugar ABC transporter permease [Actinoplanes sp. NPDC051411]|uniref:carbohydrate ABC transporter permease n=1 Tax=Actinoplanes sp. NPDC051411 TaxID=3155522 RepID=UPI0034255275
MAKRRVTLRQRDARAGLALVSPTVLIVCLVLLVPMLWAISIAFQDIRLINIRYAGFFGKYTLDNFTGVLKAPGFWTDLRTTVLYTIGGTAGSLLVGLAAALAVRRPFRGRAIVRGLILLPYVAPVVAVAFVWTTMLNPQFGVVNDWGTRFLGWNDAIPFLSQPSTALLTVIAFETWRYYPFAFLFLMARLQAVPADTEEAARVDGATPLQSFRYILLPQLLPTMAVLFVLRFVFTFSKFDDVYLLTGGGSGTEVVSVRVYELLTSRKDVGAACAQAVILAVVLVVFLIIQRRATRRWNGETE